MTYRFRPTILLIVAELVAVFAVGIASAQNVLPCDKIADSLSSSFASSKLRRNDSDKERCNIDFDQPDLMIAVEMFGSRTKSEADFNRSFSVFRNPIIDKDPLPFEEMDTHRFWDRSVLIRSSDRGGGVLLMIRGRTVTEILAPDLETLLTAEIEIRRIVSVRR